jgi:hypothetical protein
VRAKFVGRREQEFAWFSLHAVQNAVLPAPGGDGGGVPGRQLRPALPASVFGVLTSLGRAAGRAVSTPIEQPGSNAVA